jgi:AcrR family transcriptional regulator
VGTRRSKQAQIREAVIEAALTLFADRPFSAVTIDEIAASAGISRRTFFRYFPTKEDVVLDPRRLDREYALDALSHRPEGEDDIAVVMRVMTELQRRAFDEVHGRHQPVVHRLSHFEPELMARSWLLLERARNLVVEGLVGPSAPPASLLHARILVGACLMAVDAAITTWSDAGMIEPLDQVLARAEADLRTGLGLSRDRA